MKLVGCLSGILALTLMSCSSSSPDPATSGGSNAGGAATGGAATGGAAMGGAAMGGAAMGGSSLGGSPAGGGGSGAGGTPTGMAGTVPGGRPAELPASESKDDMASFLKNGGYKQAPWVADVEAPRESHMFSQHPSKVRVFANKTVLDSLRGQRDGMLGRPSLDQWSMLVKEMYDEEGTNLVGIAAAFKTQPGGTRDGWTFFCYGPDFRCTSRVSSDVDNPIHGNGNATTTSACMDCHGGLVLTAPLPL